MPKQPAAPEVDPAVAPTRPHQSVPIQPSDLDPQQWATVVNTGFAGPVQGFIVRFARRPQPAPRRPPPTTGGSSVPSTPCVGRNLSIPLPRSGQVASPGTPTRFHIECLRDLLDLLRRLNEQAQAGTQAPTHTAGLDGHHGADRAGNPGAPGPLGPSGGDRRAPGINTEDSSRPEP
jgi:hypothetical protein